MAKARVLREEEKCKSLWIFVLAFFGISSFSSENDTHSIVNIVNLKT